MMGNILKASKYDPELEHAEHFIQWVTLSEPSRIVRLDWRKDRKRPDFAFYYPSGQRYTLELTSWLTPELKELQSFLQAEVSHPLGDCLLGTFALYIPFEKLLNGRVTVKQAHSLIAEIKQIYNSHIEQRIYQLSIRTLAKVRDDGHKLVPILTCPETVYLDENSKTTKKLKSELSKILSEAKRKFHYYRGIRVLVLDISQNGLDIDYHACVSKEGPGIVCRWLSTMLNPSAGIHYVCLSQGMRVWGGGGFRRMLTGHVYEGKPMPNYKDIWHKPKLPHMLQSFGH